MPAFQKLAVLRDNMEEKLQETAPELVIFSADAPRVSNTTAMALPDVPTETQVMALDLEGIAISGGSACSSGKTAAGHVARAMNVPDALAKGASRVSLGWDTSQSDIDEFIKAWSKMYGRIKKRSPS